LQHVLSHAALLRRCLSALSESLNFSPSSSSTHAQPTRSVGFLHFEPDFHPQTHPSQEPFMPYRTPSTIQTRTPSLAHSKLGFNVDAAAIAIALLFAALIRLNVIHHIGW